MALKYLEIIRIRKGTREKIIKAIFNKKSARAREIHKGAKPNKPKIGTFCKAHEISLDGSRKAKLAEKAMKKKIVVSIADPKKEEIKGAFHHFLFLSALKIEISNNCATRNPMAEPMAILKVTKGPNSPIICVPMNEQKTPITNPHKTTFAAAFFP